MTNVALAPSEQAEHPVAQFEAHLTIGARSIPLTFEVYGEWQRGFPGSRETPAEPKYLDVRRVLCNGHDVLDWMNDDSFSEFFYSEVYGR